MSVQLSTGPMSTETDVEKTYQVSASPTPRLTQQHTERCLGCWLQMTSYQEGPAGLSVLLRRSTLHLGDMVACYDIPGPWESEEGWSGQENLALGSGLSLQAFPRGEAPGCLNSKPGK